MFVVFVDDPASYSILLKMFPVILRILGGSWDVVPAFDRA